MLDEFTRARLSRVGDLSGARCLEIGAGGGSIARWLGDQVGPTGRVLATDLNTRLLPEHPGYTRQQHDLTTEPVPEGPWDLIHARLVLAHIPSRREIFGRLVEALAPGGALVIQEWDGTPGDWAIAAPDQAAVSLLTDYQRAVGRRLQAHGLDYTWARELHGAMLAAGMVDVDTEVHARAWPGGTPGALLLTVTLDQLRDELLGEGFTAEQLDRVRELTRDPRLVWRGLLTYSTIGRRPA
ncbi:class I SAM-dependent methyltransferase [Natronosporangium hydrolyticum]|uniref:Class I SAM-dependent methyltransferase n=2 Tax=Natronosporangium hydrolyticum TaxID=2811111 RepID=A0A895YHA9_9ACTN|nr:class I SAM-dependent methyltransferase [Natronosporangium hydrolyticum]